MKALISQIYFKLAEVVMALQPIDNAPLVHSGTISKIDGSTVIVTLNQNVHCESCRAKASCGISDTSTKEVIIANVLDSFAINEEVNVLMNKSLGLKAVLWAYIAPFILMLSSLLIASYFIKEWVAGIVSILILLPYYLALYRFKDTLKSVFKISISKT